MINYQPARPENGSIAAMIYQRGYGLAHGSKGNIKYIGAYGMESCLAVGIVLKKSGELYPRIAVGHIDVGTPVEPAIDALLVGVGHEPGEKGEVYFASADMSRELLDAACRKLPVELFKHHTDFSSTSSEGLIFDLANGLPIDPKNCVHLHTYGVPDDDVYKRIEVENLPHNDRHLVLEIDMRAGIPTAGLELYINSRNPTRPALGLNA